MICMDANFTLPFLKDLLHLAPGRTKIVFNCYERQIKQTYFSRSYKLFQGWLLEREPAVQRIAICCNSVEVLLRIEQLLCDRQIGSFKLLGNTAKHVKDRFL